MNKRKGKGNVTDRFEDVVSCLSCSKAKFVFANMMVSVDSNSVYSTLTVSDDDTCYSILLSRRELLKAEKSDGLEAYARKWISIGMGGIILIAEKNPFSHNVVGVEFKNEQGHFENGGTFETRYSGE